MKTEKEPQNAEGWRLAGIEHQKDGNFDEALAAFNKAIELAPSMQLPREGDYYYNRGLLYKDMWEGDLAAEDFRKAIELNPDHNEARDELNRILFTVNKSGAITRYNGKETSVTIPQKIGGIDVQTIGYQAFAAKGLTNVTLPKGVTEIGEEAFYSNQLSSIIIPESVTEISFSAFRKNQLSSVTIPKGVKKICRNAFEGNQLSSITICEEISLPEEQVFDNEFDNFYNSNGKKSGTYLFDGKRWSYKA